MGVELQTASDVLVLIPIKDITQTKMRIKTTMNSTHTHVIESLVEATFYQNCLGTIKRRGLNFGVISPSREIIDTSRELGAIFTFIDEGKDLNLALSQAMIKLPPNQPILIIMPDLPFFSVD